MDAITFITKRPLDGLIVVHGISSEKPVGPLPELELPTVAINRPIGDQLPLIAPDNVAGGRQAALHLLERGCRRLAMVAGPRRRYASDRRLAGYRAVLGRERR